MGKTKSIKENYPTTNNIREEFKGGQTYIILKFDDTYILERSLSSTRTTIDSIINELNRESDDYDVVIVYEKVNKNVKKILEKAIGKLNFEEMVNLENLKNLLA